MVSHKRLIDATANVFEKGLGLGVGDNEIPSAMLQGLKNDVYLFSALKTHAQLEEVSRLLLDENGKIKPFQQFANDVSKIRENYNQNYLEAEYNFAVNSAQMAAKWAAFEENKGRYNLQYRTAGDEKVRESHAVLANITLPLDDVFWKQYFPPNGWRCRCTVVEVSKSNYEESNSADAINKGSYATTQIAADGKNRLEIFRFNPGMDKVVFPPTHPYHKLQNAQSIASKVDSQELRYAILRKTTKGGKVLVHDLVNKTGGDYNDVLKSCDHFANKGETTLVLPKFHATKNNSLYEKVYGDLRNTPYWGKCPDMKIGEYFYEHEGFKSKNPKNALRNMLNRGLKQSSRVIIEDTGLTKKYLLTNIISRVNQGQIIDEVWVKKGNKVTLVYKNTEAQ